MRNRVSELRELLLQLQMGHTASSNNQVYHIDRHHYLDLLEIL